MRDDRLLSRNWTSQGRRWGTSSNVLDWIVAAYATYVALVAATWASSVSHAPIVIAGHALLVVAVLGLPSRGAAWEQPRPADGRWRARLRATAQFLRYTYPALLLAVFWSEGSLMVNAAAGDHPYWFEPWLYAADHALFGGVPAVMLSQPGGPLLDDIMHGFFFAYYPLVIGGIVIAWRAFARGGPGAATRFNAVMTTMMLGFLLSYVWYPFLPARGPWEHPEVMAGLRPFEGHVFVPLIELIIAGGSVSGACFPSAHVSGTWALVFGLYPHHRRTAVWFAVVATGLTVATVYTRYHHAVDAVAGLMVAALAALIGRWLTAGGGRRAAAGGDGLPHPPTR